MDRVAKTLLAEVDVMARSCPLSEPRHRAGSWVSDADGHA